MTASTTSPAAVLNRVAVPQPPAAPPAAPPVRQRANVLKVVMGAGVWALPLLIPAGPGNTAPADMFLAVAIIIAAIWFTSRRHAMRFPYVVPIGLSILAGALASVVAYSGAYISVGGGLISLIQDTFLLTWAITIANVSRDPALLRTVVRAWAISATCWAAVMIIGVLFHISLLSGQSVREGVRASFTLGDPNLAANYFICSLLVLRAAQYPRRRALRWVCCALIVTAILLTGSNGGALVLVLTAILGCLFRTARRRGAGPAIIAASALVFAALAIAPHVHVQGIVRQAQANSSLLRDSIGRQGESSGSRSTILSQTAHLYLTGDSPIGLGPGGTKVAFQTQQYAYVKMAHDDYAAALVERGVLGGVALICLLIVVAVRCRRIASHPLHDTYADIIPRPELLGAAVIAMFISAMFYQVLHFRHLWALLGVVAAVDIWGRRDHDGRSRDAPEPAR